MPCYRGNYIHAYIILITCTCVDLLNNNHCTPRPSQYMYYVTFVTQHVQSRGNRGERRIYVHVCSVSTCASTPVPCVLNFLADIRYPIIAFNPWRTYMLTYYPKWKHTIFFLAIPIRSLQFAQVTLIVRDHFFIEARLDKLVRVRN